MFFQLVLAFSGLRFVQLAFGETFEALLSGLQGALWALDGVPEVVRQDNLSAATHQLREDGRPRADQALRDGRRALRLHGLAHPARGVARERRRREGARRAQERARQALLLRGSRDFPSVDAYVAFVARRRGAKVSPGREDGIAEERAALEPLPSSGCPSTRACSADVRKWSTITVARRIYSVPSRLIGHRVEARVHADVVDVHLPGVDKTVETMPRLRGDERAPHRLPARHLVAGAEARSLRGVPLP